MNGFWQNLPVAGGMVVRDEPHGQDAGLRILTVRTGEMVCQRCAERAADALGRMPGVLEARLQWEADRAVVVYRPSEVSAGKNPPAPGADEVCDWAARVLAAIETGVDSSDHRDVCGHGGGPSLLV